MGTHPIFESDFDCLTDKRRFRIMSDTEAPAAPVPVAAPGSFTVETAVQDVLKQGAIQDGLSRGLNEAVRALERKDDLIVQAFKAYDNEDKIDSKMIERALRSCGG